MKFKYIFIKQIENDNKISISKTLKDCCEI